MPLLTPDQIQERLSISRSTFNRLRVMGAFGEPNTEIDSRPRYHEVHIIRLEGEPRERVPLEVRLAAKAIINRSRKAKAHA